MFSAKKNKQKLVKDILYVKKNKNFCMKNVFHEKNVVLCAKKNNHLAEILGIDGIKLVFQAAKTLIRPVPYRVLPRGEAL